MIVNYHTSVVIYSRRDRSRPCSRYKEIGPSSHLSLLLLLAMASQETSLPASSAGRTPNRELPFSFSPYNPEIDISESASQASIPSTTSTARCQHRYTLTSGKGSDHPWLTLYVTSRSPSARYLPMFIGNDEVIGSVHLDLPKPENIHEVTITVSVVSLPLCARCNCLTAQ